jgi:hypothetical protein
MNKAHSRAVAGMRPAVRPSPGDRKWDFRPRHFATYFFR